MRSRRTAVVTGARESSVLIVAFVIFVATRTAGAGTASQIS